MNPTERFRRARDFLLRYREDYEKAYQDFTWPTFERFNWARDWFDVYAQGNPRLALRIIRDEGPDAAVSFAQLASRSNSVANFLAARGVAKGDRLLLMLSNTLPIWDVMLASIKLGVVVIPATPQLTRQDVADRLTRGNVRHVVTDVATAERFAEHQALSTRLVVGGKAKGFDAYDEALSSPDHPPPDPETRPEDPLLLYFTSGTTAKPKLVLHTHQSYPVGHLSTLYWLGIQEGDVHQNISSPGWAKHAWSSFFAPWTAGACVLVYEFSRFIPARQVELLRRHGVNTLCAPPTVWRMMINESLGPRPPALRELLSAGEPLNPEVIERVRRDWGITLRDGYGQTETTCQVGNSPGQVVKPGSMGRPMPGYQVVLLDAANQEKTEGELSLRLTPRPLGLMVGYLDNPERNQAVIASGYYRTGDEAQRDEDGYLHYVGRGDEVFKSSDYRISPFELESVLIEHPGVAEAAVVPSPDPMRLSVPKAFVVLRSGYTASRELAHEILAFTRQRLAPYKRIRRLEFAELPKTTSGKIRRVQLRAQEAERRASGEQSPHEFDHEDSGG